VPSKSYECVRNPDSSQDALNRELGLGPRTCGVHQRRVKEDQVEEKDLQHDHLPLGRTEAGIVVVLHALSEVRPVEGDVDVDEADPEEASTLTCDQVRHHRMVVVPTGHSAAQEGHHP